jgi:hypothetical protein
MKEPELKLGHLSPEFTSLVASLHYTIVNVRFVAHDWGCQAWQTNNDIKTQYST